MIRNLFASIEFLWDQLPWSESQRSQQGYSDGYNNAVCSKPYDPVYDHAWLQGAKQRNAELKRSRMMLKIRQAAK